MTLVVTRLLGTLTSLPSEVLTVQNIRLISSTVPAVPPISTNSPTLNARVEISIIPEATIPKEDFNDMLIPIKTATNEPVNGVVGMPSSAIAIITITTTKKT
jgi:hypothetical protein